MENRKPKFLQKYHIIEKLKKQHSLGIGSKIPIDENN